MINISKEVLKQKYEIEGKGSTTIGKEFNVGRATILRKLRECGIPIKKKSKCSCWNKYLTKEVLYHKYWTERKSCNTIGKEFSINHGTIYKYLKKYNIPIRDISEANKGKVSWKKGLTKDIDDRIKSSWNKGIFWNKFNISRDILYQKYWIERISGPTIAKEFNVSYGTILNYLRKYNISIRSFSEAKKGYAQGKNNPNYGKHPSEETRQKMRLNHTDVSGENNPMKNPETRKKATETIKRLYKEGKLISWNKGKPFMALEKNPNWLGGKSFEPYGLEFNNKLREQIRQRDNYRCQQCFRHQDEFKTKTNRKYKLVIHHIDFCKNNNNSNNLISLCLSCHLQTNYNRENWTNYFQEKIKK